MDRFRGAPTQLLIAILSIVGLIAGGTLGLITERGLPGIITVVSAIAGAAAGVYIAQSIAMGSDDVEP